MLGSSPSRPQDIPVSTLFWGLPMTNQTSSELLDTPALAALLGLTPSGIRNMLCRNPENLPPPVRIGRRVRWRRATVERWLGQHEAPLLTPPPPRGRPRNGPDGFPLGGRGARRIPRYARKEILPGIPPGAHQGVRQEGHTVDPKRISGCTSNAYQGAPPGTQRGTQRGTHSGTQPRTQAKTEGNTPEIPSLQDGSMPERREP